MWGRLSIALGLILVLALPAAAQVNLSEANGPHDSMEGSTGSAGPGPELGRDYLGLPVNDAARLRADSWDPSRITLPEEQCRVHLSTYIYRGPMALRIWEEKDPDSQRVIAIKNYISTYEQTRTDLGCSDGRPHPSEKRSRRPGWVLRRGNGKAIC